MSNVKVFHHSIVLTGFMGTGKSAVGRLLADKLGKKFISTDELIEKQTGMKIKDTNIRFKYNINIIAILQNYDETNRSKTEVTVPQADYVFRGDDVLLVFGNDSDIEDFKN